MLNRRNALITGAVLFLTTSGLVGCSEENAPQPSQAKQSSKDWKAGLDEDVVKALSELSEEDRTKALAQKVCLVTGERLGSMDTPPKITVEGQEVFLCCGGCEDELRNNSAKYLSKLNPKK